MTTSEPPSPQQPPATGSRAWFSSAMTRRPAPTRRRVDTSVLGTPILYRCAPDGDGLTTTDLLGPGGRGWSPPRQPPLRSLLRRGSAGFTEATAPRHPILPATASVLLIVEIADSPRRPPALVVGAHDSFTVLEGAGARSWLGLRLAPLGAWLLGPPIAVRGQPTPTEVLGADGRRLGERPARSRAGGTGSPCWTVSCCYDGPAPTPEVAWAWRRLVATVGRVPIGQLADEVGWSHKHLIARFRQQVGLRPKTAALLIRFDGVLRRLDQGHPLDWGLVAREPAMPTRRT